MSFSSNTWPPKEAKNNVNVQTHAVNVNPAQTPEEGAHSPSWPNEPIIIIKTKAKTTLSARPLRVH
jgi:hypothetical protein